MIDLTCKTFGEINEMFPKGFDVTGKLVTGKRFKQHHNICQYALRINLYNGSVYGIKEDGKRTLIKRVIN